MQVTQVSGIMRPEGQTAAAMYWYLALAANLKVLSLSFMNKDTAPVWLRSWSQVIQAVRGKAGAQRPGCKAGLAHCVLSLQLPPEMAELAPRAPLGPQGRLVCLRTEPSSVSSGFLGTTPALLVVSQGASRPRG